jgi:hypothetical protein
MLFGNNFYVKTAGIFYFLERMWLVVLKINSDFCESFIGSN